jgi:hypothetical protein
MFACVIRRRSPSRALELVVEAFDGRLVEHAFAPGLALRTAQHDAPVPRTLLRPVEREDELTVAELALVERGRSMQPYA